MATRAQLLFDFSEPDTVFEQKSDGRVTPGM